MSISESLEDRPVIQRVLQSRDETRSYYNKIARVYDLLAEHSEGPMREAGLAMLAAAPGETVLEIGSGTGHCLLALARAVGPGGRVHGLDLSDAMVEIANERIRQEGLSGRVEVTRGDAGHLPYSADTHDAVFLSFTLELFDTPEIPRVLSECRRVLKTGGRIAIVAVSREEPGLASQVYEWTHRHFPNLLDCRPIYARRSLEAAGFAVRDFQLAHMWVPVEIVLAVPAAS
ncbi:MAG TPA: methyltransferase domain-containing protein [Thermoanaerobaculia bacterium]|nr:methyltransferase domain-containing protein [Thermoanaerobaculia bacterium]